MTDQSKPLQNAGTLTSLAQLFNQPINGTQVKAIEIPLFQRDYAQGRQSELAKQVRKRFLADLCAALDGGKELHLDFVFGDVVNGTLYPLDGQQRLTTLFLLHCYLAWHQPQDSTTPQAWHAFHYATRPGARKFCEFLTTCSPELNTPALSAWLCNQASYLPTWKHDPTIQGMLVVLDALHAHYRGKEKVHMETAWQRLIDSASPAIRFLVLPVAAQKLDNSLYVKMNSRGRPLTAFENFKADLEALLHKNFGKDDHKVREFSRKIDTDWTDLFWHYRGNNDLIDEEFICYLRFLFEVRAWRRRLAVQTSDGDLKTLTVLAESLFGGAVPAARKRKDLNWIVQNLDIWMEDGAGGVRKPKAIADLFNQLFTRDPSQNTTPLRIFNFRDFGDAPVGVDLFHACCTLYGTRWSLAHTVLLYGVLLGFRRGTGLPDLHSRLRLLRNLIEASRNEIRADTTRNNMPALLRDVETVMAGGALTKLNTFNQVQVRNEQAKLALVTAFPTLRNAVYQLEDHELLRGGLTALDLDLQQQPATFSQRVSQFAELFQNSYQMASAALLAKGNDGRGYVRTSGYRLTYLGAPKQRQFGLWEDHWRQRFNEPTHPSSMALMALLDDMTAKKSPSDVIDAFLNDPNTKKDWRYYLAKYEVMRGESLEFSGTYFVASGPGYGVCMPKTDSCDDRSNHHDAYLLALVQESKLVPDRIENSGWPRCFPGYETNERWLKLKNSHLKVRCVDEGWIWDASELGQTQLNAFSQIANQFKTQNDPNEPSKWITQIAQQNGIDTEDRIVKGSALMKALIGAGM